MKTRAAVDARYTELTSFGYQSQRPPYETSFGMYLAMITDPDGNTILLSRDLEAILHTFGDKNPSAEHLENVHPLSQRFLEVYS